MLEESEKDAQIVNESIGKLQKLVGDLGECHMRIYSDPHEYLAGKIVKLEDLMRQISEEIRDTRKRTLSVKHGLASEMAFLKKQHKLRDFAKEKTDEDKQ